MLDAYTVRKAIPRILLAVIGINISIYLCLAAVDIVNIIGGGIANLLTQPFTAGGLNSFGVATDASSAIVGTAGIALGAGAMTGALSSAVGAAGVGGAGFITGALWSLFFLLIPIALLALGILCVVVLRQALLFFLIVVSPVAIACFVLPGTEKYFQKWLDLFIKTLMVYPIIAVMFALSDVFSSIIFSTNAGNLGIAKIVTGIVVIFAPLFLIPFAFRLAGGAIAALSKVAGGAGARLNEMGPIKNRREYYGQKSKDWMTRGGAEQYRRSAAIASDRQNRNRARRMLAGYRASKISGYRSNILDREAEQNERLAKETAAITGNGDDAMQRAYTVNKERADAAMRQGVGENDLWRLNNGQREYRTAGGAWVSEFSVDESRRKYGDRNTAQLQQSLAYEMRKATTQEQQDRITETFASTAQTWGMSENQANGAWIGAGFANQNENLQWKHGRWSQDANGNFSMAARGGEMLKEVDEKKGSWESGRYNADTWTTMSEEVERAHGVLQSGTASQAEQLAARESIQRATRVASSLSSGGGRYTDPETGQVVESAVGQGAAPRTAEEMRAFSRIALERGAEYGYATRSTDARGNEVIRANEGYGTATQRSDTGWVTDRSEDPRQSIDDRNRPSSTP